jgi:hypothetical protein
MITTYKNLFDILQILDVPEIPIVDSSFITSALNLFGEKTRGYFSLQVVTEGGGVLTVNCLY